MAAGSKTTGRQAPDAANRTDAVTDIVTADGAEPPHPLLLLVIGACISVLVINLYFAQPLVLDIADSLGIPVSLSGSIVSASQFGYGFGLLLIAPMCDMVENRRVVLITGAIVVAGTIGIATSTSAAMFLLSALLVGVFSAGAHILVPYLTYILPPETRGRGIGAVASGILFSIMLARPFALFVAGTLGWRAIYWMSAAATIILGLALARVMPPRVPELRTSYVRTITSLGGLMVAEPQVVRRSLYQALLFATFTMFWAVTPMMLAQSFGFDHNRIALFALAGIGGALAAPLAGHAMDRGWHRIGTFIACVVIALACLGTIPAVSLLAIVPLVVITILIDGAIHSTQTFSRLIILEVAPDRRGRINAIFMTIIYMSGALGSIAGVALYVAAGWQAVALAGSVMACLVAVATTVDRRSAG